MKKIISAILTASIVSVIAFNLQISTEYIYASDVSLKKIEALAGETNGMEAKNYLCDDGTSTRIGCGMGFDICDPIGDETNCEEGNEWGTQAEENELCKAGSHDFFGEGYWESCIRCGYAQEAAHTHRWSAQGIHPDGSYLWYCTGCKDLERTMLNAPPPSE